MGGLRGVVWFGVVWVVGILEMAWFLGRKAGMLEVPTPQEDRVWDGMARKGKEMEFYKIEEIRSK
jgi:hypothetical protein